MKRIVWMFITNFYRLPYLLIKLLLLSRPGRYTKEEKYGFLHKSVVGANKGGRVIIDCHGIENLPKKSGYIMFPNHQGLYDVLSILEVVEQPFSTVMKKETQNYFLLKKVSQVLDAEIMDRESIKQSLEVIMRMARRVKNGDNFVIFAEGTRSKLGNKLLDFKGGSFKSAMLAQCPIVPVALIDSFVPFDEPSIRKTTVHVHFLEPIQYEEYKDMKSLEIAKMVSDRIKATIETNISEACTSHI